MVTPVSIAKEVSDVANKADKTITVCAPPGVLGLILMILKRGHIDRHPYIINIKPSCSVALQIKKGDKIVSIGGRQIS